MEMYRNAFHWLLKFQTGVWVESRQKSIKYVHILILHEILKCTFADWLQNNHIYHVYK